MNFLAHCLLGHPDEPLVAGGFLGDFVKGPVPDDLPTGLQAGIRLHRRIDAVSNRHPMISVSVERLGPDLRRVAPVLVDILADHCLARGFENYAGQSLDGFTQDTYATIERYERWMNPNARRFFTHMAESDLLGRYRDPAVIVRAMRHVLERLGFDDHSEGLDRLLNATIDDLSADFADYFPDLEQTVCDWKSEPQQASSVRAARTP